MHERHWDRDGDARKKENQKTLNSVFGQVLCMDFIYTKFLFIH